MTPTTVPAPAGGTALDADLFRSLLRRQASTVAVVTTPADPVPVGFTATSFTSVSLRPPIVSFCLSRYSSSWPTVRRAEYVAVHLLAAGQQAVAQRFATSGIDRFADRTAWRPGPHGVPLLDGASAWLLCLVTDRVRAGDHAVVLAEPLRGQHTDRPPLLYHDGRYAALDRSAA
ncbi:flavin oxidoreductase [Pilimelia anulata]|uniref:Flavin oxidoreductase n=1 Tax=Pilimelia anulata TaxID=53371 RepID=A0A8J3F7I2_9ACTN|nr:flavin reductase family protein [Pilimelia anulata]GGJ78809.1 flavin oxidoreductase [Pilimelia anulata]